jgi:hypothetical protein
MDYPKVKVIEDFQVPPASTGILEIKKSQMVTVRGQLTNSPYGDIARPYIETKFGGFLGERGFYLESKYDWVIVRDSDNGLVLVPLRKS